MKKFIIILQFCAMAILSLKPYFTNATNKLDGGEKIQFNKIVVDTLSYPTFPRIPANPPCAYVQGHTLLLEVNNTCEIEIIKGQEIVFNKLCDTPTAIYDIPNNILGNCILVITFQNATYTGNINL